MNTLFSVRKYLLILPVILTACYSGEPLVEQGMSKSDRVDFIKYKTLPDYVVTSFIHDKVCVGMSKNLVSKVFGMPSEFEYFQVWTYPLLNGETGIIKFDEHDTVTKISSNLLNNPKINK